MSKEHQINSVLDMLKLSPEEFARMVPDLIAWYALCRSMDDIPGVVHRGFTWVDDGRAGEIHSVDAILTKDGKPTGVVEVWPGSAYAERKE